MLHQEILGFAKCCTEYFNNVWDFQFQDDITLVRFSVSG